MWLGPAPFAPYTRDRVHFNFRWISDYSGGIIADWGAHLFDTAQWANDTEHTGPVEVEGKGTLWSGGRRAPVQASSPKILDSKIGPEEMHLYTNPAGEHDDFLKCVKSRKDPYFPVEIGHRVSTICHLANISIKLGRKLKWDPAAEKFVGDDEANKLLDRTRRDPWQLPNI
jgi:hypothetical protein